MTRRGRAVCDLIGHFGVAEIEQLACHQPALDPPLIDIDELRRVARRGGNPLRGLGDLVGAPQPLNAAEHVAGVVARRLRHRIEQRLGIAGFVDDGGARIGDSERHRVEMVRRPQAGIVVLGVKAGVHARLVVGGRDQADENVARLRFEIRGKAVIAPGFAHHRLRAGAVALREERLRQRKMSFGGVRLVGGEKADGRRGSTCSCHITPRPAAAMSRCSASSDWRR